ncbi:carbohydrate kinase family protein [Actinopolymorpha sp. B9G3]|uniref:carbohydrate kinase family protein n=1 Tax=Actinopolymorpha sp. B9G3 TaxID=3158970 RepID=UPI0032D8F862
MSRLVFVGSVNADTIAVVPRLPGSDERLLADAVIHAGGGNSATAAVTAARLGGDVAFIGPVAADEQGERIRADLVREGVDTSGLVPVPAGTGGASVVLVDRSAGTRAICTRPLPAFGIPDTQRSARDLITGAGWVHCDHIGWAAVRPLLDPSAADGPRLSVDAGNPIPGFAPSGVDLYGPTVVSLRRAYGDLPVPDLLARALDDGARCVVATDGARGAFAAGDPYASEPASANGDRQGDTRDEPVHVPGFTVDVVSTLGAGDVFHGALLVAVDRGLDLPTALRYANGVAALSCRAVDGRSGVPTDAEVTAWLTRGPG